MCYNAFSIFLYVGKDVDPFFLQEIFKVGDFYSIDKAMGEEELFADYANSAYLTALYNIIYMIRAQRQPFTEIRILVQGDSYSDETLKGMLISDNLNPVYPIDFAKFLGTITGGSPMGPGASGTGAAYY